MQSTILTADPDSTHSTAALQRAASQCLRDNRLLDAAKCFFEIVRRQPESVEAFAQLGSILYRLNQLDEAQICLEQALRLQPEFPRLNLLLGSVFKRMGKFAQAAECCRREIQNQPGDADAHYNLGLVLQNLGNFDGAIKSYEDAIALRPHYADAIVNMGCMLRRQLKTHAALRCLEQALRLQPANPEVHWELGVTLLSLGEFTRGWKEYEWRWRQKNFASSDAPFSEPLWDGKPLNGRRIFLHCEQGYGDTIQFARFASVAAERGGEVILGCPESLRVLMESVPGVRHVVTNRARAPRFDFHAPLMSLPAILGTTLADIPATVPYVTSLARDFEFNPSPAAPLNIGVAWAGDSVHKNDHDRTMPLEFIAPLLSIPGIAWHSLQVGNHVADLNRLKLDGKIAELGSRFRDFNDTAFAISKLDLVLSVDTCVAHLAGALGKPVWTLLQHEAEWRWMLHREDSPWYPTMRLFRQKNPGDWTELIERVAVELGSIRR